MNGPTGLLIFRNIRGNPEVPFELTYVSFGTWTANLEDQRLVYFLLGYPTVPGDLPRTGTATYSANGSGNYVAYGDDFEERLEIGARALLTADFGAGSVETSLHVEAFYPDNTAAPLLRLSGTGTILVGTSQFGGSLEGFHLAGDGLLSGTFLGSFYGPAGQEVGYTFTATGDRRDGRQVNLMGSVVGVKD
jgi:hypothetical protein